MRDGSGGSHGIPGNEQSVSCGPSEGLTVRIPPSPPFRINQLRFALGNNCQSFDLYSPSCARAFSGLDLRGWLGYPHRQNLPNEPTEPAMPRSHARRANPDRRAVRHQTPCRARRAPTVSDLTNPSGQRFAVRRRVNASISADAQTPPVPVVVAGIRQARDRPS
jgi:hypothetical protein